jgi:type II secretory ATPase GspE/PulE/Tfp pilus assembly ATPase PilB-like protein
MPTYYGENAVLRLFPFSTKALTLASLGMRREHARTVADAIARPHGLLLIAGPTGSGKTTTLYTLMEMLSAATERPRMLVSIEDPVERPLAGVRQIPAGVRDLSFARGLRAILRQDPDVIMVGEIRDTETAQLAVQAALTGHLVLSTLHALDIPAIVPRLAALGVDPYLAASTLRIALAERLVRTACDGCGSVQELTAAQLRSLSQLSESQVPLPIAHRIGSGCGSCDGTGYRGRTGVFDVAIGDGRPSKGELAFLERPSRLPRESVRKVAEGSTTCEEALRIGYA